MDESIKQYLRRIGSKGGKVLAQNPQAKAKAAAKAAKAIAGTPKAKARAAKAAKARWAKAKAKTGKKKNQLSAKPIKDESLYEAIDDGTVVMPWGKYKGLQLKHIDPRYLNWVLENSVTELQRKLDEGAVRAARRGGYKEASEVIKRIHQPVISSDLKVHLTAVTEQWEKYGGEHPIYRRIEEPN